MDNTSKPSEVSVIKSKSKKESILGGIDGFFSVRLRLTLYYALFTAVIIGGFSIILYQTLLTNFAETLKDTAPGLNPHIFRAIIDRAHLILVNRLFIADIIILLFATVLGYLLTHRTLKPMRDSMQKQKRFIADASHELRTPIAVVISGLEVALRNKNLGIDDAKKTLTDTLDEMKEFSLLTNQLLDLSKTESSEAAAHATRKPINIAELVRTTSEKMKKLADEKEINFTMHIKEETPEPVRVLGNDVELSRVFYNIIHNAISYTPNKGSITVEGHISLGKYVVTITDTGIGIPSKILGKIFEPFFQGDASRNESKNDQDQKTGSGAGLGLPIAKKIVESHSGSIVIKSKEHGGTKAVISLPLSSY